MGLTQESGVDVLSKVMSGSEEIRLEISTMEILTQVFFLSMAHE